ncbi:MAG: hypothetical protein ACE5GX_12840 [Thermoanaerobaculia bacterium]
MTEAQLARGVEVFAALNFVLMGLSHLLQPRQWVRFFAKLREMGEIGSFVNAIPTLFMGSIIVAFHSIWTWPAATLTVLGWIYLVKSLILLVAPRVGLKSMSLAEGGSLVKFRVAGLVLLSFGVFLGYLALQG